MLFDNRKLNSARLYGKFKPNRSFVAKFIPLYGPLLKTWCHPQNRKYITYRNDTGGGPSHGHRQHAQKFNKDRACGSEGILADRQTDTH